VGYLNDLRELVGDTPMLRLNKLGLSEELRLLAKLELFNPGGSVKDRIGLSMIEAAEKSGALRPGGAIVEATAGNTGIGVALAALGKGYRVIFAVPEKFSVEKVTLMKALGAQIVRTPAAAGMGGARAKAAELLSEIEGAVSLDQFENPANPRIHYETTGPEILRDSGGEIDYFVAGAGSGGTFSGVARYLKERIPGLKAVLADPLGSTMGGGECGSYAIEGIGNSFVPGTMDMGLVDEVVKVSDDEALAAVRLLAAKEGVIAGTSSGAALSVALTIARRIGRGNIVTIIPDRGDRYFSKGIL
jgi:cysteine synthase A